MQYAGTITMEEHDANFTDAITLSDPFLDYLLDMDETMNQIEMDLTKISTDSSQESNISDATQGHETMLHSVPLSPTGPPSVVALQSEYTNTSFGDIHYENGANIHEMGTAKISSNSSHVSMIGEYTETSTESNCTSNDGKNTHDIVCVLNASSVCLQSNYGRAQPSTTGVPDHLTPGQVSPSSSPSNSLHGSITSNAVTKQDLANTSRKTDQASRDPFKDFPVKNGVCLKHKGRKGISGAYRSRRKCLFQRLDVKRTKKGKDFSNEWIQEEIIDFLKTSLQLDEIRFFALVDGELIGYSTTEEICDAIRADFKNSTFTCNTSEKKKESPPVRQLFDLFESKRFELDSAIGIDPGIKIIYQGVMKMICDAALLRILDKNCEAELYDWFERSFNYFVKNEKTWDAQSLTKSFSPTPSMKSMRLQLKQKVGNPCKILLFEGILNDIGYVAFDELISKKTKDQLHVWVALTWNYFFENDTDKKRKGPPTFMHDHNDRSNDQDDTNDDQDDTSHDHRKKLAVTINTSISTTLTASRTTTNTSSNTKSRATTTSSSSMNTISSETFERPDGWIIDANETLQKSFVTVQGAISSISGRSTSCPFVTSCPYLLPDGQIIDAKNTLQSFAFVDAPLVHSVIVTEEDVLKEPTKEPTRGYYCWWQKILWLRKLRNKRRRNTTVFTCTAK